MENRILSKIKSDNVNLKESEIRGILYILLNFKGTLNLGELILKTGLPKTTVMEFLDSIKNYLKTSDVNKIQVKEEYKEVFSTLAKKYSFRFCRFTDKDTEKRFKSIQKEYNLSPKREFDQFFATPKTSVQKALVLEHIGMHFAESVALIGDDDLVSVAIALKYPKIKNITVLEIDEDLVKAIQSIAEKYKLPIKVIKYDIRNEIPTFLYRKFDVVLTDPPYTSAGIELFLDRSISLLKPHTDFSGKYILLNYGNSFKSPQKFIEIQRIINNYHLFLEDSVYKFNRYFGAQSIGSASTLYVLKTTPNTRPKEIKYQHIYTYEVMEKENFPYIAQYVFKLLKVPDEVFKSVNFIDKATRAFCKEHKIKIKDLKITKFDKNAYTFTYILESSNLVLHTWADFKAIHIDLVVCSKIYNATKMPNTLAKVFKTNFIDFKVFE